MVCAAACHSTVGRTIYEPLAMLGTDGQAHPYLLESITPNDDFTVWTLVVAAGHQVPRRHRPQRRRRRLQPREPERSRSSWARPSQPIAENGIVSDGAYTVTVTMDEPWPAFPTYLNSQLGYMGSPTWIQAAEAARPPATRRS